ncbi:MAG: hypothetical protein U5K37_08400 [Natrialbaceae archaeon]|nr:hypothetical protein [Natrialbaceae archaeon]
MPTEEDVQPVTQTYVERDSASEVEPVLRHDSTLVATDPQAEWELTRIKAIEETGDGSVLEEYSAQRGNDGIYVEREVILRESDGEWLIYENQ